MFIINYMELGWWYWFVTACLLTAGVAGYPIGFLLAIGLTAFQLIHFAMRERSITTFPIQVRFGYLMFLLVALPEPMQVLYWVPVVGTWVQLTSAIAPWRAACRSCPGIAMSAFRPAC